MRRAPKYVLVALPLCLLLCFYVVAVTNSPPSASSFQSLLPSLTSSSSLSGDHDLSTTAEAALPRRNRLEHSLPHHDDYDESLSTVFGERRISAVAPIHTLYEAQMMPFGKDEGSRCAAAAAAETTTEGAAHRRAVGLASPRSTTKKTQLSPSPSSSPSSSFSLFDVPRDAEEQGHYRFRGTKPQHWVSSYHSSSTSSSSAVAKSSRSQVVGSSSGSHRSPPFSSASSSSSRPREEEEVPTTASAIKKRHDVVVASSIPTLSRELIQTAAAVDEMMLLGSERGGFGGGGTSPRNQNAKRAPKHPNKMCGILKQAGDERLPTFYHNNNNNNKWASSNSSSSSPSVLRILIVGDSTMRLLARSLARCFQADLLTEESMANHHQNRSETAPTTATGEAEEGRRRTTTDAKFREPLIRVDDPARRWPVEQDTFEQSRVQILFYRAYLLDVTFPLRGNAITSRMPEDTPNGEPSPPPFDPTHIIINRQHDYIRYSWHNANGLHDATFENLRRLRVLYPRAHLLYHGVYKAHAPRPGYPQHSPKYTCERLTHLRQYRAAEWTAVRRVNHWILQHHHQEEEEARGNSGTTRRSGADKQLEQQYVRFFSVNEMSRQLKDPLDASRSANSDGAHFHQGIINRMVRVLQRELIDGYWVRMGCRHRYIAQRTPNTTTINQKHTTHHNNNNAPQRGGHVEREEVELRRAPPPLAFVVVNTTASASTSLSSVSLRSLQLRSYLADLPPCRTLRENYPFIALSAERLLLARDAHGEGYSFESVVRGPAVPMATCGLVLRDVRVMMGDFGAWREAVAFQHAAKLVVPSADVAVAVPSLVNKGKPPRASSSSSSTTSSSSSSLLRCAATAAGISTRSFDPYPANWSALAHSCLTTTIPTYSAERFVEDVRLMRRGFLDCRQDVAVLAQALPLATQRDVVRMLRTLADDERHRRTTQTAISDRGAASEKEERALCDGEHSSSADDGSETKQKTEEATKTKWTTRTALCIWEELVSLLDCSETRFIADERFKQIAPLSLRLAVQPERYHTSSAAAPRNNSRNRSSSNNSKRAGGGLDVPKQEQQQLTRAHACRSYLTALLQKGVDMPRRMEALQLCCKLWRGPQRALFGRQSNRCSLRHPTEEEAKGEKW